MCSASILVFAIDRTIVVIFSRFKSNRLTDRNFEALASLFSTKLYCKACSAWRSFCIFIKKAVHWLWIGCLQVDDLSKKVVEIEVDEDSHWEPDSLAVEKPGDYRINTWEKTVLGASN